MYVIFIMGLLCTKHYAQYFKSISSLNSQNSLRGSCNYWLTLSRRGENWGPKRLSKLFKITLLVKESIWSNKCRVSYLQTEKLWEEDSYNIDSVYDVYKFEQHRFKSFLYIWLIGWPWVNCFISLYFSVLIFKLDY